MKPDKSTSCSSLGQHANPRPLNTALRRPKAKSPFNCPSKQTCGPNTPFATRSHVATKKMKRTSTVTPLERRRPRAPPRRSRKPPGFHENGGVPGTSFESVEISVQPLLLDGNSNCRLHGRFLRRCPWHLLCQGGFGFHRWTSQWTATPSRQSRQWR